MEDLLNLCKYYKGEDECPVELSRKGYATIWRYEKIWVENPAFRNELDVKTNTNFYEYKQAGLIDFNVDDGVPVTLKALLFNRYRYWSGEYENVPEGFKQWYKEFV